MLETRNWKRTPGATIIAAIVIGTASLSALAQDKMGGDKMASPKMNTGQAMKMKATSKAGGNMTRKSHGMTKKKSVAKKGMMGSKMSGFSMSNERGKDKMGGGKM